MQAYTYVTIVQRPFSNEGIAGRDPCFSKGEFLKRGEGGGKFLFHSSFIYNFLSNS